MEVIALRGPSNCGKTSTLTVVYHLLLNAGYVQMRGHFFDHSNRDFMDVLEKNGRFIGIATQGDYQRGPNKLSNHLAYLNRVGCTKCICALTDKPGVVAAVIRYPLHRFINKAIQSTVSLQRIDDNRLANTIFRLI